MNNDRIGMSDMDGDMSYACNRGDKEIDDYCY